VLTSTDTARAQNAATESAPIELKLKQTQGEVDADIHSHTQQSDLGNAITYRRNQNVESDDRGGNVPEFGNEIDDGIESEAPIEDWNSKLVVH